MGEEITRLIAPELSPSKTVEGSVGGVVGATLLGAALWRILNVQPSLDNLRPDPRFQDLLKRVGLR